MKNLGEGQPFVLCLTLTDPLDSLLVVILKMDSRGTERR